jgi:hypothetical protein
VKTGTPQMEIDMKRNRRFSRVVKGGLEAIQLSSSLTLAQQAVEAAVASGLKLPVINWECWEILVPEKKEQGPSSDALAAILQGELAELAGRAIERSGKDVRPFLPHLYAQGNAAYRAEHEHEDGIDMRHVFFRSLVNTHDGTYQVRAIVRVWGLSRWWHAADIKIWVQVKGSQKTDVVSGNFRFDVHQQGKVSNGFDVTPPEPPSLIGFN